MERAIKAFDKIKLSFSISFESVRSFLYLSFFFLFIPFTFTYYSYSGSSLFIKKETKEKTFNFYINEFNSFKFFLNLYFTLFIKFINSAIFYCRFFISSIFKFLREEGDSLFIIIIMLIIALGLPYTILDFLLGISS